MLNAFILKVKRGDTSFYRNLYIILKKVRRMSFPSIKVIHLPLYYAQKKISDFLHSFWHAVWVIPVFKARLNKCGHSLKIINGMPYISGDHLTIEIGDNVNIVGGNQFIAGRINPSPYLKVGDRVSIGYHCEFSINHGITIGDDTIIATGCNFADSNGHQLSAGSRLRHESVRPEDVKPITIGKNVWIARGVQVQKGVTIGDNSIVAVQSVVTKDVPPNTIVGGIPATVIGKVPE